MNWTNEKIEQTLKERAAADPEFRKLAMDKPDVARKQILDDQAGKEATKSYPKTNAQALSDGDLDEVSGGGCW